MNKLTANQRALTGMIALILVVGASTIGLKAAFGAFDGGYELITTFADAGQNLDTQSDVKMRGVNIGSVRSIKLSDGRAVIKLRINDDVDIPVTAAAAIRPISIFGPKFVDVIPGDDEADGPFLTHGDEIDDTESPLELTGVLAETYELLEAIDPQDVATVLRTFADSTSGLGSTIGETIDDAGPLLDATLASTEDRQRLITDLSLLAERLSESTDSFVVTAENAHEFLPVITNGNEDLGRLLSGATKLSNDLADVLRENETVLGPGTAAGARVTEMVSQHRGDLIGFIDFVRTYGAILDGVIRVPHPDGFLLATQQFLLPADPCMIIIAPGCEFDDS